MRFIHIPRTEQTDDEYQLVGLSGQWTDVSIQDVGGRGARFFVLKYGRDVDGEIESSTEHGRFSDFAAAGAFALSLAGV